MALALRQRAPIARPRPQLFYCRPSGIFTAHDALVAQLRQERDGELDIETLAPHEAAHRLRTWVSATQPTLFVVRDGDILGVAIGPLARVELEHLIRHVLT